jgi:hypothetical protein
MRKNLRVFIWESLLFVRVKSKRKPNTFAYKYTQKNVTVAYGNKVLIPKRRDIAMQQNKMIQAR